MPTAFFRLRDALAHSYSGQASPRPCFSFPSCPLPLVRHLSSDQPYLPTRRSKYEYTNSEGRMKVRTEKSRRKAWSLNADVEIKARLSNKVPRIFPSASGCLAFYSLSCSSTLTNSRPNRSKPYGQSSSNNGSSSKKKTAAILLESTVSILPIRIDVEADGHLDGIGPLICPKYPQQYDAKLFLPERKDPSAPHAGFTACTFPVSP